MRPVEISIRTLIEELAKPYNIPVYMEDTGLLLYKYESATTLPNMIFYKVKLFEIFGKTIYKTRVLAINNQVIFDFKNKKIFYHENNEDIYICDFSDITFINVPDYLKLVMFRQNIAGKAFVTYTKHIPDSNDLYVSLYVQEEKSHLLRCNTKELLNKHFKPDEERTSVLVEAEPLYHLYTKKDIHMFKLLASNLNNDVKIILNYGLDNTLVDIYDYDGIFRKCFENNSMLHSSTQHYNWELIFKLVNIYNHPLNIKSYGVI